MTDLPSVPVKQNGICLIDRHMFRVGECFFAHSANFRLMWVVLIFMTHNLQRANFGVLRWQQLWNWKPFPEWCVWLFGSAITVWVVLISSFQLDLMTTVVGFVVLSVDWRSWQIWALMAALMGSQSCFEVFNSSEWHRLCKQNIVNIPPKAGSIYTAHL